MLRRIEDPQAFRELVEVLYSDDMEDWGLQIEPDTPIGLFLPESRARLAEYCVRNPDFHIVSIYTRRRGTGKGIVYINAYVADGFIFMLARGVSDPRIVYDPDGEIDEDFYRSLYSTVKRVAP
jgi:hypothetical protein